MSTTGTASDKTATEVPASEGSSVPASTQSTVGGKFRRLIKDAVKANGGVTGEVTMHNTEEAEDTETATKADDAQTPEDFPDRGHRMNEGRN